MSRHNHYHNEVQHKSCVSLVTIFNHLNEDHLEEIMAVANSYSYKKGEIIYHAGQLSDSLHIVSKGKIRIYRLSDSGKEQLIRVLNPGEFTGELALFREAKHEAYAEVVKDAVICKINRSDFQELLIKFPTISLRVLSEFANRLELSEKQSASIATEKVETRIALYLVECIEKNQRENTVTLPMTKKDLASYLGTTPETISRRLADLEKQGYIKQQSNKKIEILDVDGLLLI